MRNSSSSKIQRYEEEKTSGEFGIFLVLSWPDFSGLVSQYQFTEYPICIQMSEEGSIAGREGPERTALLMNFFNFGNGACYGQPARPPLDHMVTHM